MLGQRVHGQPLLGGVAVVNAQVTGLMVLPATSLAPETVAVYVVVLPRAVAGVNVAVRVVAF